MLALLPFDQMAEAALMIVPALGTTFVPLISEAMVNHLKQIFREWHGDNFAKALALAVNQKNVQLQHVERIERIINKSERLGWEIGKCNVEIGQDWDVVECVLHKEPFFVKTITSKVKKCAQELSNEA